MLPDIEPLPAVTDAHAAAAPGAPLVHDEVAGNLVVNFEHGDLGAVRNAFSRAAHVTRLSIRNNRVVVSALEPRAAIGDYDSAQERWTLRLGCQGVFGLRENLKTVLGVPVGKIRVLTGNVGGSFGMKASVYPGVYLRPACEPGSGPAGEMDGTIALTAFFRIRTAATTTARSRARSTPMDAFSRSGSAASPTSARISATQRACRRPATPSRTASASIASRRRR